MSVPTCEPSIDLVADDINIRVGHSIGGPKHLFGRSEWSRRFQKRHVLVVVGETEKHDVRRIVYFSGQLFDNFSVCDLFGIGLYSLN